MPENSIKLVCFDLGGVLVRICRTWEEGCRAAGLDVRTGFRNAELEPRRKQAVEDLQTGDISSSDFWVVVSECLNRVYTPQEIERVHRAWLLGEYQGVVPIIQQLRAAGYTTACLSNTNAVHWEDLLGYESLRSLDHLYASHTMGLLKPDTEIYEAFEQSSGFAPCEILFFEDTPENTAAARDRGWHAQTVDPEHQTAPQILEHLAQHGLL